VQHFSSIVDYSFTSEMEQQLDDIAEGEKQWGPVLRAFYTPFERTLATARETMRNVKREEVLTELTCPKCSQGQLAIKFGRNGEFLACNRYPECDFTSNFHRSGEGQIILEATSSPELSDVACNICGRPMVTKKSRFGPFLGCSGYPECKNTRRLGRDGKPVPLPIPTGVRCPKCQQGELMQRRGKFGRPFFGCDRYPKCDYIVNELAQVEAYEPSVEATSDSTKPAKTAAGVVARPAARAARTKAAAANGKAGKTATRATSSRKASASTKKTKA
jgi:DNA topoisomerase I